MHKVLMLMAGSSIITASTQRRDRWFLAALLLALASAVIPALFAWGMADQRSVGSAFDPTNEVVALHSRQHSAVQPAQIVDDQPRADAAPDPVLAMSSATPAPVPAVHAASAAPVPPAAAPVPVLRPRSEAQPRAPPSFKA